jgi:tRNA threonylcarbamoyl adenosine modification protein (Sua5/YciO/YrdC/YwlC family)
MAAILEIHPDHPQPHRVEQAAEALRGGDLLALPTDSGYALCGHLGDAGLLDRIRRLRGVDERHLFTLMCRDLSEIATYAKVDNATYRLLKATTPGSYTFILEGSKELPRRVLHPKRKTIGLRIPDHKLTLALLQALGEPMLTSTLIPAGEDEPLTEADEIEDRVGKLVDLIVDAGTCGSQATTVVNLVGGTPELVRAGRGPLEPFGF